MRSSVGALRWCKDLRNAIGLLENFGGFVALGSVSTSHEEAEIDPQLDRTSAPRSVRGIRHGTVRLPRELGRQVSTDCASSETGSPIGY